MITEDQSQVIAFLSSPAAHAGATVVRIDTHASIVFLAGERAWKLKRAVRYDYLDYSTADLRRAMCEAEVRVNRRTAAALYRGVTAITRQMNGSLSLGGDGPPVDWLVEMVRFDQNDLFDRLAEAGILALKLMDPLAQTIARFHARADERRGAGGWDAMRRIIDGNASGFAHEAAGILDQRRCQDLTTRARFALDRVGNLLDQRRDEGFVRHCHGDLHLRNILLWEGRPTLFDAIEFNEDIASIDVLYDLAFLLMDLWRLGLPHHANVLWNAYLAETMDLDGLPLMPLFMSCRAAVMAKTTATSAILERDGNRRQVLEATANDYIAFANRLLDPPQPRLVALGGLSGTGKSTLAELLASSVGAPPGAVVLRSDAIRKRLCEVTPTERLGPEGYTDDVSRRVYATLFAEADTVVRGGFAAVADAVFANSEDRDAVQHVAAAAGVPFTGIWLDAPEPVLIHRVAGRKADVSDADAAVIRRQRTYPLGLLRWHHLDASGTRQQVFDGAAEILNPAARVCDPAPPSRVTHTLRTTLLLAVLVLVPLAFNAAAQVTGPTNPPLIIPSMYGQDLFDFYCASCHGRDGKGRGPVVPALNVSPPDLTLLTARHGGTFPRAFVESFVAGNRVPAVPAHGSKDMPVWGPIFLALDPNVTATRVRIENIVGYIESIQKQP